MVVLDLLVSSILGRPPATATLRPDIGSLAIPMQQDKAEEALIASYRMSLILDEIITRLYGEKSASAEAAESLLGRLNQWSQSLPNSLLASPASGRCEPRAQGHILGSFNVACSYHFAVIVVTRPFLISSLSLRLARTRETVDDPSQIPQEEPAHSRLATACIDSATYMMQTCMEVHHSQLLLGNMCILKCVRLDSFPIQLTMQGLYLCRRFGSGVLDVLPKGGGPGAGRGFHRRH